MTGNAHFAYLSNIKPQEIELGTLDLSEFGIFVGSMFFYKNTENDPDFMPLDVLAHSFCRLVVDHYPIVAGRPTVNSAGKGVIVVDPDNLNMPDFDEITVEHPAESFFETLPSETKDDPSALFFNTRKFNSDSGISRLPKATYHRDNASVVIRIIRFKDSPYTALMFSFSHVMFDGISAIMFMTHWAEYMRNFSVVEDGAYQLIEPPLLERKYMEQCFENVEPLELPSIRHFKENVPVIQMESPKNIAPVLMATPDVDIVEEQHLIHFTAANLERMRQDIDPSQTTNTVLAAVMTKNVLLANIRTYGTLPKTAYMVVPYDSRSISGIPRQYAGNASFAAIAPLSPQMVTEGPYRELVLAIKEHTSKRESGHTKAALLTIENELALLYQASFTLCNSPASSYLCITSMRYMPLETIDFGYGAPCITAMDYSFKEGMAHLLPNRQDGGTLSQVKLHEIELGALDLIEFGIILDSMYFYKNENDDKDFMSMDKISRSFCKLVVDFGHPIINAAGKGVIKVDPDNLCIPDFEEVNIEHPAEAFFETRPNDVEGHPDVVFFNTRKFYQTSGIQQFPKASYQQDNSAVIIRVLRFKDSPYSAFTFSLSHVIFDGIGAMLFINHWAEYARNLESAEKGTYKLTNPPLADRQILTESLKDVEPLNVPFISHFKENVSLLPIELPPNIAPVLMKSPDIAVSEEQHLIHFSGKALNQIRDEIDSSQTTNTVIAALMAKNMLLANLKVYGTVPLISYIALAYDCRMRLDIPQQFSGNAACAAIAPLPSQQIIDGSYKDLAAAIKKHGARIESGHTKTTINVIENELALMYQAGASLCNSPLSSYVGMTNLRYMPFDTVDFGYGGPGVLAFDYYMKDGMIRIIPNKQDEGVDLVLNFRDAHFEEMCKLDDIKKYANVIY
ncbi:hypothetical protein GGI15_002382 [Coemansia interrupta]|uniref:Uncharacterized protein n=1 Tax=Coemansia interrupta TaxID=1126814 RepID=A0A9W8HLT3_9FUNG|nr:hypothetical protein GGI15_002382 [Coemansia interrupta]